MYYKLIDGIPHKMVMPIRTEKGLYFGNSESVIKEAGYKRLVCESAAKADGYIPIPYWVETENEIKQLWRLVPESMAEEVGS